MSTTPVTTEGPAHAGGIRLRASALRKSFGPTRALVDMTLEVEAGSIVGVVGENGSGKSTFVKILSGILPPDGGSLEVAGESVASIRSPVIAARLGIATVFQEILVVHPASVLDNIFLGQDVFLRSRHSEGERRRRAHAALSAISSVPIDLDTPVELLTLSQRQLVVIARALVRDPAVLILDESTSALDVRDRDRLFEHCRSLRDRGCAIVFITHRLEELLALADTLVIIRDGETVGRLPIEQADRAKILELMTRAGDARMAPAPGGTRLRGDDAEVLLILDDVEIAGRAPVTWQLEAGTIVGLAGLEGHGQERFLRALAGLEPPTRGRVEATRGTERRTIRSRFDAGRADIAYLPRSRSTDGILPSLSILDNFALPTLGRSQRFGIISMRRLRRRFAEFQRRLSIRLASMRDPITSLSGGNQQKVLIARWLAAEPRVVLLDDPTRGVDLPTKVELHALLRDQARAGCGVVLLTTDLEELEAVCDAVLVFHEGTIVARLAGDRLDRDAVLEAMFGPAA